MCDGGDCVCDEGDCVCVTERCSCVTIKKTHVIIAPCGSHRPKVYGRLTSVCGGGYCYGGSLSRLKIVPRCLAKDSPHVSG